MRHVAIFALFLAAAFALSAADEGSLNPHLAFLEPLLGKTWQGTFVNSPADKPIVDVQHWERALNGQAVRALHSVNKGIYGGETLLTWDDKKKTIVYHYFTTEDFMTTGTITTNGHSFVASEQVIGDADGITEVRSTNEITADGKFHVKAVYEKNGQWVPGHECIYTETPDAQVIFK